MPDRYPLAEESVQRLVRSGWAIHEAPITVPSGLTVHQAGGANGENRIVARGATLAEAWYRAVQAAASCGMLEGWPRPSRGVK
jgi:hypothetical protein